MKRKCEECSEYANCKYVTQQNCPYDFGSQQTEIDALKAALRECFPVAEAAFYDNHSAGVTPGRGYTQSAATPVPTAAISRACALAAAFVGSCTGRCADMTEALKGKS